MKKIAILLIIAMCFALCGCPESDDVPNVTEQPVKQVHIVVGKVQPGMTAEDVSVEVTIDNQTVECRKHFTCFTENGYYEMDADAKYAENTYVRLNIYYSLPQGCDVDDVFVTMDCDGGADEATGSIGNDKNGCVEAWSYVFYGEMPNEETTPEPTDEPTPEPTATPEPTTTPEPTAIIVPTEQPPIQQIHAHNWISQNSGQSYFSCTTDSIKVYACSCGETKKEVIPAPGHDMQNTGTTQPTCTEIGSKTMRCSRCSYALVVEIPETGHNWSAWENDTGRVHKHTCTSCGAVETANHNIPSGDVICTDCGAAIIN